MKTKLTLLSLILIFILAGISFTGEVRGGDVECSEGTCVVKNAKNKFLRKGCKGKDDHYCAISGDDSGVLKVFK